MTTLAVMSLAMAAAVAGLLLRWLPRRPPRWVLIAEAQARAEAAERRRLAKRADRQLEWAQRGDPRAIYGDRYLTLDEWIERYDTR